MSQRAQVGTPWPAVSVLLRNTFLCVQVPSSSAQAAPDRPGGSSAEQSMQGDRARAQAAEAAARRFEASRAAEEEEEDQPAPRKQQGWLRRLLFGHGSDGNPAAQAALAAGSGWTAAAVL